MVARIFILLIIPLYAAAARPRLALSPPSVDRPVVRYHWFASFHGCLPRDRRCAGLSNLAVFDRLNLRLDGRVNLGSPQAGLRFDGAVSVDADYPTLSGRVVVSWAGGRLSVPLPSFQMVPHVVNREFSWELRMRLFAGRF